FIQDQQLFTVDVSDPATPQVIAQSSMPGLYGQFVLVGSLAYVANLGRGLEIFDLAAPDNVQPLGAYRSRSYALDLVIKGDHAYVALLDEGLNIIDIGNPTAPELVGNLLRLGPVYDVASAQGKLYCIAGWDGLLHQWNLQASPCLPAEICHVSSTAIFDFVVQDHLIYAIDPRGLLVIDVADATVPTTLATYPLADAWSLALADHTVYISGRSGTVTAIDVHDPAQPQLLATYADLGFVRAMVFAGDYAYLPRGEGEIAILAVAPTGELTALGSFQLDSTIHDITIVGANAYIATLRDGLTVLDLHDPTAPQVVSTFTTPGDARDFVAHGALGYLADGAGGLRVIDINDPTQLREVGYYLTPDSAQAVTYVDGLLYVADTCGGLVILRYSSSGAVSNFPY
ncbi:MAG: hypothetical protein KDE58_14370, partial [Caldilineaceae bacterium]|nr:hypothetical protein [Caldilineaceae bacterium]